MDRCCVYREARNLRRYIGSCLRPAGRQCPAASHVCRNVFSTSASLRLPLRLRLSLCFSASASLLLLMSLPMLVPLLLPLLVPLLVPLLICLYLPFSLPFQPAFCLYWCSCFPASAVLPVLTLLPARLPALLPAVLPAILPLLFCLCSSTSTCPLASRAIRLQCDCSMGGVSSGVLYDRCCTSHKQLVRGGRNRWTGLVESIRGLASRGRYRKGAALWCWKQSMEGVYRPG